jgi:Ca2+/Na+ antiporter
MFTFRTALAAVLVAALVAAIIFSSGKQLELWKKILFTSLFAIWMFLTVGVEIVQETQQLWEGRTENQSLGYEGRALRKGANSFVKYASASVFAPLIFTIPFSTMVTIPNQENQMLLNGANFTKNIMSGLTILALFLLLIRGDWRKHVLPIAVMCGYLVVLVFSNFAHSERFHFPVLPLELMFAAYGVSQLTNKHKRWYTIWVIGIVIANIGWAWIKLAGRGLAG